MTFLNPYYEGPLRLDSIPCVIDAEGIFAHGYNERVNFTKLRQISFADLVVLNKVDLIGPEDAEVARWPRNGLTTSYIGYGLLRPHIVMYLWKYCYWTSSILASRIDSPKATLLGGRCHI
jgi:hypothetical protein